MRHSMAAPSTHAGATPALAAQAAGMLTAISATTAQKGFCSRRMRESRNKSSASRLRYGLRYTLSRLSMSAPGYSLKSGACVTASPAHSSANSDRNTSPASNTPL